jgi:SAM-dependent methyltransferase
VSATNANAGTLGAAARAPRRHPGGFGSPLGFLLMLARQACQETRVRGIRGIAFRVSANAEARRAYARLTLDEFEAINQRQAWANWRTIRRNLAVWGPARVVRAIDLCCGTGRSTEVLAYYLEPGSVVLGVDSEARFVAAARARCYRNRLGQEAAVSFACQSVLEPLRDAAGDLLPPASVDMANSSGAVGCHFDARAAAVLADEVDRVLRPGGLALIDCGPDGTRPGQLVAIFEARGFDAVAKARSCALDRYWQVCFRKREAGPA